MFSSFVDGKVISRWADRDPMQQLFDSRLERERLYDTDEEDLRHCYRKCTSLFESGTGDEIKYEDVCVSARQVAK